MAISKEDYIMPAIKSEPLEQEVKEVIDKYYKEDKQITDKDDKSITIKIEPWYPEDETDFEIGLISPSDNDVLAKTEPELHKEEKNGLRYLDIELIDNTELNNGNIDAESDTEIKKEKFTQKRKNTKDLKKKIHLKKCREKNKIGAALKKEEQLLKKCDELEKQECDRDKEFNSSSMVVKKEPGTQGEVKEEGQGEIQFEHVSVEPTGVKQECEMELPNTVGSSLLKKEKQLIKKCGELEKKECDHDKEFNSSSMVVKKEPGTQGEVKEEGQGEIQFEHVSVEPTGVKQECEMELPNTVGSSLLKKEKQLIKKCGELEKKECDHDKEFNSSSMGVKKEPGTQGEVKEEGQGEIQFEHIIVEPTGVKEECEMELPNTEGPKEHDSETEELNLFPATTNCLSKKTIQNKRKAFKCSQCSYAGTAKSKFEMHLVVHSDDKPVSCTKCNFTCKLEKYLKNHMRNHSDEKPFQCPKCKYSCKQEKYMKSHLLIHNDQKPYSCLECNYTSNTKSNLKMHMYRHTGLNPFQCHLCNGAFATSSVLKKHVLTHNRDKSFMCHQCNFACKTETILKTHLLTHSTEKPFKCSKCNFRCISKRYLQGHMLTHSDVKPFVCLQCGFAFKMKKKLKRHMLIHIIVKPFRCLQCNKGFRSKKNLKSHLTSHNSEKSFICAHCSQAFRMKHTLIVHLLYHSDAKPFSCSECTYACKTKSYLKIHMISHSKIKPFLCPYCNFSSKLKRSLEIHKINMHYGTLKME